MATKRKTPRARHTQLEKRPARLRRDYNSDLAHSAIWQIKRAIKHYEALARSEASLSIKQVSDLQHASRVLRGV